MTLDTITQKPSANVHCYAHNPAIDSAILDVANSRQLAFRHRLRNRYWLTDCKPIGSASIASVLKKMHMIDTIDVLSDDEKTEILTDHYGFENTDVGFIIPALLETQCVSRPSTATSTVFPNTLLTLANNSTITTDAIRIERTLKEGMSYRGGWSKLQLALIGIDWPPRGGWKTQFISEGFKVSGAVHDKFVAIRKMDPKLGI